MLHWTWWCLFTFLSQHAVISKYQIFLLNLLIFLICLVEYYSFQVVKVSQCLTCICLVTVRKSLNLETGPTWSNVLEQGWTNYGLWAAAPPEYIMRLVGTHLSCESQPVNLFHSSRTLSKTEQLHSSHWFSLHSNVRLFVNSVAKHMVSIISLYSSYVVNSNLF